MQWYKHYPGDYITDTLRLTMIEDGAYRRLIDEYYSSELPLPLDLDECCGIARTRNQAECDAVHKIVPLYFEKRDDGYHNPRIDEEIAKANRQAEINRRIAADREAKRRGESLDEPLDEPLDETGTNPDSRLQTPDSKGQKPEKKETMSSCAQRVFEYWQQVLDHPRAKLDKDRKRFIMGALKTGYKVDDLMLAIDGCANTPHNMGGNDRGHIYDGIHIIFKNADQIERFMGNANLKNPTKEADELKARMDEIKAAAERGDRLVSKRTGKELQLDDWLLRSGDKSLPLSVFLKDGGEIIIEPREGDNG